MGLREVADELYATTPADFTASRNAAAGRTVDKALAKEIRALRKPTASAAAVNALVREDPELVDSILAVGDRMRDAFAARDRDSIRSLTADRQRLLQTAVQSVGGASPAVQREVQETLQAAVIDASAAAAVRSGLLVRALESTGVDVVDVADAVALPIDPAARPRPTRTPRRKHASGDRTTEGGSEPTQPAVSAAERRERERRIRSAEKAVERARATADALDDELPEYFLRQKQKRTAAFLPDSAVDKLFAPGTENRFSGQGTPTGMMKKVEGGYLLNGKWSYGSGMYHATYTHSAALVDDGTGKPAKDENGNVIVLCAHAPVGEHGLLGNWDVIGLRATGSIDYDAKDIFIPDDFVFPILTAEPQRLKEFFSLGVVGLAAIGHSGWAIGTGRRMMDEIAKFARSKTGRSGLLGESDKFWFDYGRAEARVRAARAFLFEVWADVEASIEAGQRVSTRQISLIHLAKSEVHEAGVEGCQFAYRAAGGASLRAGVMQRVFREMMTAANHFTINPNIVGAAGREIGGVWSDRAWQFYDLIPKS